MLTTMTQKEFAEEFFWKQEFEKQKDRMDLFIKEQKCFYLDNLQLTPRSFDELRILDVGCGPVPGSVGFVGCEVHGIDPLVDTYQEIGYPDIGIIYTVSPAENMTFQDEIFDAVISVNAIDHVDDFEAVALEIKRVLKPDGLFCMHVHYHPATVAEPHELNDEIFLKNYAWVSGLHKVKESNTKNCATYTAPINEKFVLWSNMKEHNA